MAVVRVGVNKTRQLLSCRTQSGYQTVKPFRPIK